MCRLSCYFNADTGKMFHYKVIFIKLNSDRKCGQAVLLNISMTGEQYAYSINDVCLKASLDELMLVLQRQKKSRNPKL